MDKGCMTGVVFLDLKKAFDTVDHTILLNKLATFNISPQMIEWFEDYLTLRKQAVKSQGKKSEFLNISCGVPQGSILGPLLFIMYINDLVDYLVTCKASLYADDTALYTSADSQVEIMLNLRIDLSIVYEWLNANKLTLNTSKTKYIVFGNKSNLTVKPDLNLTIGGKPIERVSSMKYLGVILDEHLTFDEHIQYILFKSSKKLGILRRSKEYLNNSTRKLLYQSLILPHMDYCDTVYMCTTEKNLQKLQIVQNSAFRIILEADIDTPISELHKKLEMPNLKQRRSIHLAMECFNNINNKEAGLHSFFVPTSDTHVRTTRQTLGKIMNVPNIRTNTGRKSIAYRGPNFWNHLETEIRIIDNKNNFKREVTRLTCLDENHPG